MSWLIKKMIQDKNGRVSLARAAGVCVLALLFMSATLWVGVRIVETAVDNFNQAGWSGGKITTEAECTAATGTWNAGTSECFAHKTTYTGYDDADTGVVAGTETSTLRPLAARQGRGHQGFQILI